MSNETRIRPRVSSQGLNEIDIDDKETYFKGIEMKIDDQKLADLFQKVTDARENVAFFAEVGDWNMVKAWTEQVEFANEKIKQYWSQK